MGFWPTILAPLPPKKLFDRNTHRNQAAIRSFPIASKKKANFPILLYTNENFRFFLGGATFMTSQMRNTGHVGTLFRINF